MSTTRAGLLRAIAASLAGSGIDAPEREARILLKGVLGISDLDLIGHPDAIIGSAEVATVRALAERRRQGEPMARLLGRKPFWTFDLALAAETLVPRPETETLVEAALALWPERTAPLHVLDLGTGTGAILAAILSERPCATGVAVDLSEGAARQARANLAALGLSDRSGVVVGSWGEALGCRFDLVVSNPPYIVGEEIESLEIEVRAHDPRLALDGGADGLDAYRALAQALPDLLAPEGAAVVELGAGQEPAVSALFTSAGLRIAGPARKDLAGIPRALVAVAK
ncbi:peptide chain release factor N(5)-glutamine methyltransferase [Ancylobacter terrae]|uniref:peptide chain release factor N(5)-glutamine methyltransferase n=1 Tax=Ancylobacter sp. sgz301288 TaxID=3342077 RepID=UPI00385CE0EB